MTRFLVRIELPDTPPAEYRRLHRDLKRAFYFRVIEGRKGWWHLPHAEYAHAADRTASEVKEEALALAYRSHPDPRVLVVEIVDGSWSGLRPVTFDDPEPDDG